MQYPTLVLTMVALLNSAGISPAATFAYMYSTNRQRRETPFHQTSAQIVHILKCRQHPGLLTILQSTPRSSTSMSPRANTRHHSRYSLSRLTLVRLTLPSSSINCIICIIRAIAIVSVISRMCLERYVLTDIGFCPHEQWIPQKEVLASRFPGYLTQNVADAQRLEECAMLENPPDTRF